MSDKNTDASSHYDANEKTLWVYRAFEAPKTLIPGAELQGWTRQLQAQKTADGEPLARINVVFADEESAEYNHQPLTFSKLGVYVGDRDESSRYHAGEGDPSFDTRSDFGIE